MNDLEKRIIEISYKHKLSHIGSCLTSVNLIDNVYSVKKKEDIFILSNGHAGLALYVVLEKYGFGNAEDMWKKHGTHPNRDPEKGIIASSGSLGHGIGIAVGMALADRRRTVYVLLSDGECAEGSVWEALRIASEYRLENLRVTVNANGYGAYGKIDSEWLDSRLQYFYPSLLVRTNLYSYPDFLQGIPAHYVLLDDDKYKELMK